MEARHFPPPLTLGDPVVVVAPSGPFPRAEFFRGLAWLRGRYAVECSPRVLERDGYLAGTDDRRGRELAEALEGDARAVIAARGGYGLLRLLPHIDWTALTRKPKWLVGFSDPTVWHVEAARLGVASVHAPNVTGLGLASPRTRAAFMRALERPHVAHVWTGLHVLRPGRAEGRIFGGNLALLDALSSAGRLVVPEGALLAVEDVTERPYRVDRMLTSLLVAGHVGRAAGVVFGGFSRCEPAPDGVKVNEVLRDFAERVRLPAVAGAPFGHEEPNEAFVLGRRGELVADRESGELRFGARAVSRT